MLRLPAQVLTHVHLYNALAKNMIPAINEKYEIATVLLVRWSSDSAANKELIKIKGERLALSDRIHIHAGHPPSPRSSTSSARPQVACHLDRTLYHQHLVSSRTTSSPTSSPPLAPSIRWASSNVERRGVRALRA